MAQLDHQNIPVHQLEGHGHRTVTFERILPMPHEVRNSVHRHDHYEIFVFAQGEGTHMIDLRSYPFHAPCMHVVEAGQVHHLVRSGATEGFVIMFEPTAVTDPQRFKDMRRMYDALADRPHKALSADRLATMLSLADAIERELIAQEDGYDRVLENYLGIALTKCAQWAVGGNGPAVAKDAFDIVGRFKQLVEKNFAALKQVSEYAEQLSVTPGYLNEKVKERLGTNASGYIHARLLLEAKRLLLHSELSVKEAGFALGMQDPAYFTRWFKKVEGFTPADYRSRVRNEYKGE